jgi:hypothetical protein
MISAVYAIISHIRNPLSLIQPNAKSSAGVVSIGQKRAKQMRLHREHCVMWANRT